jgi:hypothetical protein
MLRSVGKMTSFDFGNNEPKEEQLSLDLDRSGERYAQASEQMITEILRHYQKEGFPYLELNQHEKQTEFLSLSTFDEQLIYGEQVLSNSTGVTLANCYHPHRFEVACNDHRTAMYVFKREHLLRKCIAKCLKMSGRVTPSSLRSMLCIFEGVQVASNFPPATAKEIYETFLPNQGSTFDMSCGWGGRLLAALASDAVSHYQGCEPSTKTHAGLSTMLTEFPSPSTSVLLSNTGSEVELPSTFKEVDLCFTSPPYYNTERYADEDTQSFKKFPSHGEWMDHFMRDTLRNCLRIMKSDARLIVNIANVNTYNDLTKDFVQTAELVGFKLEQVMRLELSTMPGQGKRNRSDKNKGNRNEPIFVFRKK